jgi:DNA-binding beta-propeller fold protein YncE
MAFDGLYLWVAVYGTVQVLQVDIDTGQVVRSVTVGTRPHSVVYNGKHIFVTNFGSNSVSKIDP